MTSHDEALRALEKAAALVDQAEHGAWMVDRASPPYETTGICTEHKKPICEIEYGGGWGTRPNGVPWLTAQAEAIVAAVNFVRDHSAALLSSRQEVAPVAYVCRDVLSDLERNGECIVYSPEFRRPHDAPLYTSTGQTSDARDALDRVDSVLREFEGMTGAGYKYMAANIRAAIKGPK